MRWVASSHGGDIWETQIWPAPEGADTCYSSLWPLPQVRRPTEELLLPQILTEGAFEAERE